MHRSRIAATARVVGIALALATGADAEDRTQGLEALDARLEELLEQSQRTQAEIERLRGEIEARGGQQPPPAESPPESAAPESVPESAPSPAWPGSAEPMFSGRVGSANLLADLSLDVLAAVGGSTARDSELELLEGGGHDPRQRGFTLQQVELSLLGAVDPFVNGEMHLVYFLDPDGDSQFEVEEAFLQSVDLPFGLAERGFQVEAGHFFTEFGRMNPTHPHAWDWQDQPFVLTRLLGGDGMRAPGVRVGWLLPLPWFSELHLGVQNAKGETMTSFLANREVFDERPIGGRPFADPGVHGLADLVYLIRSTHGFDVSDETSGQLGGSVVLGPNATGHDGATQIFGGDLVLKWRPLEAERGWPFLKLQGEILYRRYQADDYTAPLDPTNPMSPVVRLPSQTLDDYGGYVQLLWGFRRGFSTGLRYEYGDGCGSDVAIDPTDGSVSRVSIDRDPYRAPRQRVSPLLVFQPSEFTRLRLQYDYDHQTFLKQSDQHSVWAGVEIILGSHPAHGY